MQTQLIQKKAQIGSQVEFTLTTGNQVSGILKEMSLEHVTLDAAKGEMTILVDSIIAVQSLDDINTSQSSSNTPDLENQIDTSNPSNSSPNKIEIIDSANLPPAEVKASDDTDANPESTDSVPEEVEASDDTDANTESTDSVPEEVEASDDTDANPESTDSVPEEVEASDDTDANTESDASVNFEDQAYEKLIEIEKRFNTETGYPKIELKPPDFTFPADELKGWQNTSIAGKWLQIKNKYENAQRINELSTKFGRIQPLLIELTPLVRRFPNSSSLKRVTAYFYAVSDDWREAIQIYKEVAITSEDANDWFNVAVSALNLNKEELACYSLEKYFNSISVIDKPNAWSLYVNLVEKFNNLSAFRELCKKDKNDVAENEVEVLLDAAIYLFKSKVTTELAIEIVQKRIKGEPAESLLKEVAQKLGGRLTESYRQFLTKFMDERIASEKKGDSIHPAYSKPLENTELSTRDAALQKPYSRPKVELIGEELYREAQKADKIDKNLVRAEQLYRECIRQNIRHDSAIKDLAMVFVRLDRSMEAVELLEKKRPDVGDKQSLDNTLIMVYSATGQYEKAIDLLNNSLKQTSEREKRGHIHLQISSNYIKLGNYLNAEKQFREVLKLRPNNITVQRNLALCLSKQGHYKDAEKVLRQIQRFSRDAKTATLLEAVDRAQKTGEFILDDDRIIEIETALSYFSGELSRFAQFFLERCTFEGVRPERVEEGKYVGLKKDVGYDIRTLEQLASRLGTRHPRDRSNYYLSAAKIYFDTADNQDLFYRYLCRSFASRGDAEVGGAKNLDTARELYCEALAVYPVYHGNQSGDEQDAVNSLVRYLFSTFGRTYIPKSPDISIRQAVSEVIPHHSKKGDAFRAIAYLVLHSRYAADRLLRHLYDNVALRQIALDYLEEMEIPIPSSIKRLNDFIQLWDQLRHQQFNKARTISNDLRLLNNFELSTAWLEDRIKSVEGIRSDLFFTLDQQRVGELQRILETALELCKQVRFEERERLCIHLLSYCQSLLGEIEGSPTRLSVEDVYPIIEVIRGKVEVYLEELYVTSKPQLTLRLPVESYAPTPDRRIDSVQIVVENESGRSPAESLELVIEGNQGFFEVTVPTIKRDESLRGGEQSILTVPLRVTPDALQSRTFSLPIYLRYHTRAGEQEKTPVQNFSIRLYSEDEFENIENPYATYAEGGIVGDAKMFFGREELIQNIAQTIRKSRTQSKSVMVFGQKRSGKSSVLYHLKEALEKDKKLLVLDLGNIGTLQDPTAKKPLLYQFLYRILRRLETAIRRKQREGFSSLGLSIPRTDFYEAHAPLQYFEDTFEELKDLVSQQEDWNGVRVVLLIDEFQYIYDRIVAGEIPESFMQNWKALLQANHFNAVLVGQDVMQKFKDHFPNEFGTTQDERVTYLNELDAIKLIEDPIRIGSRQGDSRYREQAVQRIYDLTAGNPFYIQIICNRLVEYMNNQRAGLVTEADVEKVESDLIEGPNSLDRGKFDNLINSRDTSADVISDDTSADANLDKDALKILKTIADNSRTDPCPRDRIDCQTSLPVDTILNELVARDVVECDQGWYYHIPVGLFKKWLITNE